MSSNNKLLTLPIILVLVILVAVSGLNFYTSKTSSVLTEEDVVNVLNKYIKENPEKIAEAIGQNQMNDFLNNNADDIIAKLTDEPRQNSYNNMINKFIKDNPHVIIESLNEWQRKQGEEQKKLALENIQKRINELHNDPNSPTTGNLNGDITIVEFFDYNCGFCKKVFPSVKKILENDPNVKVVFKEFPILSQSSETLAKFALAVNAISPEKYLDFHAEAMINTSLKSESGIIKFVEKWVLIRKL